MSAIRTTVAFMQRNDRGRMTARERLSSEARVTAPVISPDDHEALVEQLYDDFGRSRSYWMARLGLSAED